MSDHDGKHGQRNVYHNVTSNYQTGGITAHTVHVGPQPRTLHDQAKQEILAKVPRDRPVNVIFGMGDSEAQQFATEIFSFLKENDFKVGGLGFEMHREPIKGVNLRDEGEGISLLVGSNLP